MPNTIQTLDALRTSFRALFQNGLGSVPEHHKLLSMMIPSSTASNTYGFLKDLPRVREWIGERHIKQVTEGGYTIVNKKWELSIGVSQDNIDDDNLGIYSTIVTEMGRNAAEHPNELAMVLLGAGNSSLCWDGQYFFDTDHPLLDENDKTSTYSNWGGGSGNLWALVDCSKNLKPLIFQSRSPIQLDRLDKPTDQNVFMTGDYYYGTKARYNAGFGFPQLAYGSKQNLTQGELEKAETAMRKFKGDRGRRLGINPTHLLVHPDLYVTARNILKRNFINGGETNPLHEAYEIIVVDQWA